MVVPRESGDICILVFLWHFLGASLKELSEESETFECYNKDISFFFFSLDSAQMVPLSSFLYLTRSL